MILAIFAMSLDLLVGITGLVSLGHAAYFGIGAYVLALRTPRYDPASFWTTLPLAVGLSALAAFLVGIFVVRVKSTYFIMATLAFAQMFYFLFHDTEFGRGSDGITMNFKPAAAIGDLQVFDFGNPRTTYFVALGALALVLGFLRFLLGSPFGRALRGIKANEQRMRSLGFRTYHYKLASFTLAGALAGLAGYLSALQYGYVNPELLSWHQSGNVLLMVILGGPGTFTGAALGAFGFALLQEVFQAATLRWQLLLGATIVLLVLFVPGGLASLRARFRAALVGGPRP
ncbi:MAG: branched-chain amino acid ABC transporter permease [Deltaproteobacteria bacterium]|nr:branched-chain amino acid ABC transporter permease [Deltaproteobacteria bacterium]